MGWKGLTGRGVTARVATINGYAFPSGVRQRFSQAHPDLSAEDIRIVEDAVRQWFRLATQWPRARLTMPSLVAGDYWQEFALHIRDYADFCERALGRPFPANSPTQRSQLRETFQLVRRDETAGTNVLPLLFRVDSDLGVPGGPHYLPDCGGRGQCFGPAGMICLEHVDGVGRRVRRGWRMGEAPPPGDLGEGSISGSLGT